VCDIWLLLLTYVLVLIGIAVVTTLAGSGNSGFADGVGVQASFSKPSGVAVDISGTVFVADFNDNRIRKILPTGGA
jgi:serine/threonine-protein kinase